MVVYDPTILRRYANRINMSADLEILGWSFFGLFLGAIVGAIVSPLKLIDVPSSELLYIGALVGVFLGFLWGREKAFMLKVQAQQILCQVEIEQNTRLRTSQTPTKDA